MSLKNIVANANAALDEANDMLDIANTAMKKVNTAMNGVNDIKNHYNQGQAYYHSEEGKADFEKAKKLDKVSSFVAVFTVVLWVAVIVGTIVLCVTGNDMILRFLKL